MAIYRASFQAAGRLNFDDIVDTYVTLISPEDDSKIVHIFNSCNQALTFSFDGGITDTHIVPAGHDFVYDFVSNSLHLPKANIQVKYDTAPSTSGFVSASICKVIP